MLVTNAFRSTHAFFGRLRDMTDFSSSPPKMRRSVSNGSTSATQTQTKVTMSTSQIPIDPRLLDATEPDPSNPSGPSLRRFKTRIPSHTPTGPATEPTIRELRKRRKRRARQVFQPEAGSLCSILHDYAGESLFIKPMMWTNTHLSAFGVKFVRLPPCQRPRPVSSEGWKRPTTSTKLLRLHGCLNLVLSVGRGSVVRDPPMYSASRINGLSGMFDVMYPGKTIRGAPGKNHMLSLFVWGAPYPHVCNMEGLWRDEAGKFTMGFLDKSSLEFTRTARTFSVFKSRTGIDNQAVKELVKKRVNLILPPDRDADPYLAAAFVAMAQSRFYPATPESKGLVLKISKRKFRDMPVPDFADTKLRILTTDDDQTFSVYTTTVTAKLLAALHLPTEGELRSGPDDFGLVIHHTKVDIFPLLGLRERLGKALGKDLVGEVDLDGMEMFEDPVLGYSDADDSDADTVAFSTVRRNTSLASTASVSSRRILSELSNDSPEEERPSKKRRIGANDSFIGSEEAASVNDGPEPRPSRDL